MDKLNPRVFILMWGLTLLTIMSVALGPLAIYIVGGIVIAYFLYVALS